MKKWTLHVALLGALVLLTAGCDWTMYRYGPAHTGYNNTENTINVGNVANLAPRFVAPGGSLDFDSSPAVANGVVYAGTEDGLYAFDAKGVTNCSGTPKTCAPLWRSYQRNTGPGVSPAVAGGMVYFSSESGTLEAYDANGVTNCSGTPKICSPLWTAPIGGGSSGSAPTVANGVLYIGIWAFDAKGVTNCSGAPKVCSPLWTASAGGGDSSPAVANGIVYFGGGDQLDAYDANGVTNCSGTPKVCSPLWSAGSDPTGSPAVANGIVYTDTLNGLAAFNAATGAPRWQVGVHCVYCDSSPAVANGVVYIGGGITERLYAYDAASGQLDWSFRARDFVRSSPSVANGVVYIGAFDSRVYAFDAAGAVSCSGTPKTCAPLWNFDTGSSIFSAPAIANGVVYIGSSGLYAFGL